LSYITIAEFYLFCPLIIINCLFIYLFFKTNFYNVRVKSKSSDKLVKKKISKKIIYSFLINTLRWFCFLLPATLYIIHEKQTLFFFGLFNLNNFNIRITILFGFFFCVLLNTYCFITIKNQPKSYDHFFSTLLLSVFTPYVYWTSSILSLFFIIEVTSVIFFYNFISSKVWNRSDKVKLKKPKTYANVIFFQYWVNFFGSVLMVFSIVNIYSAYGCLDFIFINYLSHTNYSLNTKNSNLDIFFFFFFLGLLIKIGLIPFHLFKQEIYKGLNFIAILFYTVYYFITFFLIFIFILLYSLSNVFLHIQIYISILSFFGALYIISFLFNIDSTKAFFAYSTVVNLMSIFIVAITSA